MKALKNYVLYHGDPAGIDGCCDGFTAAWAAWLSLGDNATYLGCNYGGKIPDMADGSRVFVLDISWPRAEMDALAARMHSLVVLDHHDTAEQELAGAPYAHFRKDHSGAWLAWTHFHNDGPPALVCYTEDRDLWQWKLPNSQAINAVIQNTPRTFPAWHALHNILQNQASLPWKLLIERGESLLREQQRVVASTCRNATTGHVGHYVVPVVNATTYISEVGHRLLEQHPEAPFVGIWFKGADGKNHWSLRSRKLKNGKPSFHVGEFAQRAFGGGGHPCAAGFVEEPVDGMLVADMKEFLTEVFGELLGCFADPVMNKRLGRLLPLLRRWERWRRGESRALAEPPENDTAYPPD